MQETALTFVLEIQLTLGNKKMAGALLDFENIEKTETNQFRIERQLVIEWLLGQPARILRRS